MADENKGAGGGTSPPPEHEITVEFVGHEDEGAAYVPPMEEGPVPSPPDGEFDAQARILQLEEACLRARADFENFRRRAEREREGHRREAAAEAATRILPVLDNLDRALEAMAGNEHPEWFQGFLLVRQQLWDALRASGVEEIDALGRPFDPAYHEAMLLVRKEDAPPGSVAAVFEKGYLLGGKVLKPARVAVNETGPAGPGERGEGNG
jgi:molecular chaperone GrpE